MGKIVFFGDSFFAQPYKWKNFLNTTIEKPEKHWPLVRLISTRLDIPLRVFAEAGSSLKFTFQKFHDYTSSPMYKEDDILCIVTTSKNRYTDAEKQLYVSGGQSQVNELIKKYKLQALEAKNSEERNLHLENAFYLEKHKDHIEWYCTLSNNYTIDIDLLGLVNSIKVFSLTHTNKIFIINAFEMDDRTSSLYQGIENTDTFKNIYVEGGLFQHSVEEFDVKNASELEWKDERRVNHFSPDNRIVLAEMLVEIIKTGNKDFFDPTKFHKKMFRSLKEMNSFYNFHPDDYI